MFVHLTVHLLYRKHVRKKFFSAIAFARDHEWRTATRADSTGNHPLNRANYRAVRNI
jgi:hypothetical protein